MKTLDEFLEGLPPVETWNGVYLVIRATVGDKIMLYRQVHEFNAYELLGILEQAERQIVDQLAGVMPAPDIVKRQIIEDGEEGKP